MAKKLTGKALAKFEAERDVWQEVLEGVREIKAGGGRRTRRDASAAILLVDPAERRRHHPSTARASSALRSSLAHCTPLA